MQQKSRNNTNTESISARISRDSFDLCLHWSDRASTSVSGWWNNLLSVRESAFKGTYRVCLQMVLQRLSNAGEKGSD